VLPVVKRTLPVAVLVVVLVLLALSPALAQDHGVVIGDNSYNPANLTIDQGESVGWANQGQDRHSVTADDGSFDSSPTCTPSNPGACMAPGGTFEHTFNAVGTFAYYCRIHGGPGGQGMSGSITVQGGPSPSPTGSPTTSPTIAPTTESPPPVDAPDPTPLPETGDSDSVAWMGLSLLAFGIGLAGLLRWRAA
jgi:LPXTG-motif cell wall-anchored protein